MQMSRATRMCIISLNVRASRWKFSVMRSNTDLSATPKSAEIGDYRAPRKHSELHRGRSSFLGCVPTGRFGLPAAKPSRGIGWYGRIASTPGPNNAACAAKSAKSSQLCGDANYSRVHAEGEPPLCAMALPPHAAVFHSLLVISTGETES